jgi:integration host factor subunit beta
LVKSELVERMAARNPHLYRRDIEHVVEAILGEINSALARRERVELRGFGVFSTKLRRARTGLNPLTGVKVPVAEKLAPFFKTGKEMRERLNHKPGRVEAPVDRIGKLTRPNSTPHTSYSGGIPRVWLAHIRRLEAELKNVESELKVAKEADARVMRARAENIRNAIARFR